MSFGFKYGVPNANYYFDVGFIRNPAREDRWGFFTDPDAAMREFVLSQEMAREFLERVEPLLVLLAGVDQYQVFAFGCNAGRHRSSIVVEELAQRLRAAGIGARVVHRDQNGWLEAADPSRSAP